MWRPERRAKKYLSARLGAGRAVARAREMAQMAAVGGADAPFGVSCTPTVRPRQTRVRVPWRAFCDLPDQSCATIRKIQLSMSSQRMNEFFMLILIEEKVAKVPIFSPPRENGGGCTPSA